MKPAALAALAALGCAGHAARMGAEPVAAGERETTLALDALVFERGRHYFALPNPELAMRWGLGRGRDVGGRVNLISADASYRQRIVASDRWALAWTAGGGVGYEPITNNTTDLIYARVTGRLIGELELGERLAAIAYASPSLAYTGPLTMFVGIFDSARFIARPGAGLGAVIGSLSLEAGVQPALALDGTGWLAPSFHLGVGLKL